MLLIDNDLVKQLLTMKQCIAVQDAAFRQIFGGGAIYRDAKSQGLGREFPTEWLVQDTRD